MADDQLKVLPDRVRHLEARMARLEDRLEVTEHRRSTLVGPLRNLDGRSRELLILTACVITMVLIGKVRRHAQTIP